MLKRFFRWMFSPIFKPVAGLSNAVGKWFSEIGFTANRMTVLGMLLCVPMSICFLLDSVVIGATLMTIVLLTDFFDGPIARYQESILAHLGLHPMTLEEELRLPLRERINFRGLTHLGAVLDPMRDKIVFYPVLFLFGFDFIYTWLMYSLLAIAVVLTAIRPLKQYLKLGSVKSTKLGKNKIWFEVAVMSLLILLPHSQNNIWLINAFSILALIGGIASLGGHIFTGIIAYRRREKLSVPEDLVGIDPD